MSKYNFYDIMKTTNPSPYTSCTPKKKRPPTSGYSKLSPSAKEAAKSRAKNFYPFD